VRFQVGNKRDATEAEALKRLNAIRDLYDRQCAELKINYWAGWVRGWAGKLAQGVPVVVDASPAAVSTPGQAAEELALVRQLQSWGTPIAVSDNLPALGYAHLRQRMEEEIARAVQEAVAEMKRSWGEGFMAEVQQQAPLPNADECETKTLHEAIDQYKRHIEQTGKRDPLGNLTGHASKCLEQLDWLKEHHADQPMWKIDLSEVERMVSYWRHRPATKRGNRCSDQHARKMTKQLFRLLNWIDRQAIYKWIMPRGADAVVRTPIRLPQDEYAHAFHTTTKQTYTPQQLAILAEHTDAFGRAILGICVNCAFGASEIGQWSTSLYRLFACHPHAATLGMQSTDADSWVVGKRPKSGIYGEHLLWEEVARAVKLFLDGREVLPVTHTGKPWYRPHSKNAQSQFGNWIFNMLERVVKKHADFPRLPFGSLRDLLPNILRREYSDEAASLALQHGKLSSDNLLDCYANLPFRKLFEATRELRPMFKPFLDALRV